MSESEGNQGPREGGKLNPKMKAIGVYLVETCALMPNPDPEWCVGPGQLWEEFQQWDTPDSLGITERCFRRAVSMLTDLKAVRAPVAGRWRWIYPTLTWKNDIQDADGHAIEAGESVDEEMQQEGEADEEIEQDGNGTEEDEELDQDGSGAEEDAELEQDGGEPEGQQVGSAGAEVIEHEGSEPADQQEGISGMEEPSAPHEEDEWLLPSKANFVVLRTDSTCTTEGQKRVRHFLALRCKFAKKASWRLPVAVIWKKFTAWDRKFNSRPLCKKHFEAALAWVLSTRGAALDLRQRSGKRSNQQAPEKCRFHHWGIAWMD
jgi:hypothetical protein